MKWLRRQGVVQESLLAMNEGPLQEVPAIPAISAGGQIPGHGVTEFAQSHLWSVRIGHGAHRHLSYMRDVLPRARLPPRAICLGLDGLRMT